MNTIPSNLQNSTTMIPSDGSSSMMKKLPWSLALAAIPFIPDILGTIRDIPDQMAKNGYALHVKHGQTEVHFNRADNVRSAIIGGGADDEMDE